MIGGAVRVLATGPGATVQDLGRPGWFSDGVGVAGAADPGSLRLANRLVGNDEDAAGIESVLGGLALEALAPATVAVTGATAPITVNGVPAAHSAVLRLSPGQQLRLGIADAGLRVYVGIRGGIVVEPVLGSRSRDTLAGIGPEPLEVGTELPVGPPPTRWPIVDVAPVPPVTTAPVVAEVVLGPRSDWFTRPADLFEAHWVVTDRLDRVGTRLVRPDGAPPLIRSDQRELPTEGMPLGAIQVPPSGEPVVFLADHPITGGYPVVGVVITRDVAAIAQARPSQHIVFRPHRTNPTPPARTHRNGRPR